MFPKNMGAYFCSSLGEGFMLNDGCSGKSPIMPIVECIMLIEGDEF